MARGHVYVGEVIHKGKYFAGEHQPILDRVLFESVQQKLEANGHALRAGRLTDAFLLTGRIFNDRGNRMTPATANKTGVRYRYYVSHALSQGRPDEASSVPRVAAPDIEDAVLAALREWRKAASTGKIKDDQPDRLLIDATLLGVDVQKSRLQLVVLGEEYAFHVQSDDAVPIALSDAVEVGICRVSAGACDKNIDGAHRSLRFCYHLLDGVAVRDVGLDNGRHSAIPLDLIGNCGRRFEIDVAQCELCTTPREARRHGNATCRTGDKCALSCEGPGNFFIALE